MTAPGDTELPVGHYAVGLTADGEEIDIYRAAPGLLVNVGDRPARRCYQLVETRQRKRQTGPSLL